MATKTDIPLFTRKVTIEEIRATNKIIDENQRRIELKQRADALKVEQAKLKAEQAEFRNEKVKSESPVEKVTSTKTED